MLVAGRSRRAAAPATRSPPPAHRPSEAVEGQTPAPPHTLAPAPAGAATAPPASAPTPGSAPHPIAFPTARSAPIEPPPLSPRSPAGPVQTACSPLRLRRCPTYSSICTAPARYAAAPARPRTFSCTSGPCLASHSAPVSHPGPAPPPPSAPAPSRTARSGGRPGVPPARGKSRPSPGTPRRRRGLPRRLGPGPPAPWGYLRLRPRGRPHRNRDAVGGLSNRGDPLPSPACWAGLQRGRAARRRQACRRLRGPARRAA